VALLGCTYNSTINFLPSLLLSVFCQFVLCLLKWHILGLHMVLVIGHHPQTCVWLINQSMWDKLWKWALVQLFLLITLFSPIHHSTNAPRHLHLSPMLHNPWCQQIKEHTYTLLRNRDASNYFSENFQIYNHCALFISGVKDWTIFKTLLMT